MEKSLYWHQGLFLQPQHFQLNNRYHESLFQPLKEFLQPYFWGVGGYHIQASALANRSFQLGEGRFLFADMAYAVLSENALIMPRSFSGAWEKGDKEFGVYIGLRKFSANGKNVTPVSDLTQIGDVTTRWVTTATAEQVPDLHGSGPEADIQHLYYVLKLFWASEIDQLGDYELIPLARLRRDQDQVLVSDAYIPPCLSIGTDENLFNIIREIRDQISARGRQLEDYKRDRGLHSAEFGARDMVYLLALRSLNRYAPLLDHLTAARHGHPWSVYAELRRLIGELSTFAADVSFTGEDRGGSRLLPDYDHEGLAGCFSAAKILVTRLLDQITAGPEYIMAMLFDGTYYAVDLPSAVFDGRNRFYLVLETEADPQLVLDAMEGFAKLGCRENLPILIARSLSGTPVHHLAMPPQELPRRANALYFQIDHHGDQWAQVQKGNNLALFWVEAPEDLKMELMIVGRS